MKSSKMETTARKTETAKSAETPKPQRVSKGKKTAVLQQDVREEEYLNIPFGEIDISPLNYRKVYSQTSLEELARSIAKQGLIQAVKVRRMPTGRYELVVGERRYRAASLAGLKEIRATVADLSDQQVREMQLTENLHREDPHPLHEAFAIRDMQQEGSNIEEIALKLVKSKRFVYSRIRLTSLIEPMQDIFLAGKIGIQDATDIAGLPAESQLNIFENKCSNWQEDNFRLYNVRDIVGRFLCNLKNAPFDTKDKRLLPDMGACTRCPFNSATLNSLFPELAEQAICSNQACFSRKCDAQLQKQINAIVKAHAPEAVICSLWASDGIVQLLDGLEITKDLPRFPYNEIKILYAPEMPDREDFDESDAYEGDAPEGSFDQAGYDLAMEEYKKEMEDFNAEMEASQASRALFVNGSKIEAAYFEQRKDREGSDAPVTAKEVQEAIKAGTATADLLERERLRLLDREKRAKELDREKIALNVHTGFVEYFGTADNNVSLTDADKAAARLLVYQHLPWSAKQEVDKVIFKDAGSTDEDRFNVLAGLTDAQYAFLIRMAIAHGDSSKVPHTINSHSLYLQAVDAGMDVAAIEQAQEEKARERQQRLDLRLAELDERIKALTGSQE